MTKPAHTQSETFWGRAPQHPQEWGLPPRRTEDTPPRPAAKAHRPRNLVLLSSALVLMLTLVVLAVGGLPGSHANATRGLPIQKGDWRLEAVSIEDNGLGDFGGLGQVRYSGHNPAGGSNDFTVSVYKGQHRVAVLLGRVASVLPGDTGTVQFTSTDRIVDGPFTYDFRKNF
jgi:hypothetical protein